MKTKIRTTLLTTLLFGLLTSLQAQDKYKYAFLDASTKPKEFVISIDGNELKSIEIDKSELKTVGVQNLMIRAIKRMEADGWELFDTEIVPITNSSGTVFFDFVFQFRKKITE